MKFKSKIEAYTTAIFALAQINQKINKTEITDAIEKIKISIENHEQDPKVVTQLLGELLTNKIIPVNEQAHFNDLISDITSSPYSAQSNEEKFENPLGRRFESEIAIQLLLHPTQQMREIVGVISNEIIKVIEDVQERNIDVEQNKLKGDFLTNLQEKKHIITLGAFDKLPKMNEIIKILKENKAEDFTRIMFIHYIFALSAFRDLPIRTESKREPQGKLREIINQNWQEGPPEEFFVKAISRGNTEGVKIRSHLPDNLFYRSALYTAAGGRGRGPRFNKNYTNQLGLLLFQQKDLTEGLPNVANLWMADSKCQEPNYASPYVLDLINNDAVYVAGPSGMTSLLLSQMEILGNLPSVEQKQIYLAAVVAYIAGGGFHSIHEIIGPAQFVLGLVPNYEVHVPSEKTCPPPNYHQFFEILKKQIPEFAKLYDQAWNNYTQFFAHKYYPNYIATHKKFDMSDIASVSLEIILLNTIAAYKKTLPDTESKWSISFLGKQQEKDLNYVALLTEMSKGKLEDQLITLKNFFDQNEKILNSDPTFVGIFLNILKENQQLIDIINNTVKNEPKLKIRPIDYQTSAAARFRQEALTFFKSLELTKQPQI